MTSSLQKLWSLVHCTSACKHSLSRIIIVSPSHEWLSSINVCAKTWYSANIFRITHIQKNHFIVSFMASVWDRSSMWNKLHLVASPRRTPYNYLGSVTCEGFLVINFQGGYTFENLPKLALLLKKIENLNQDGYDLWQC